MTRLLGAVSCINISKTVTLENAKVPQLHNKYVANWNKGHKCPASTKASGPLWKTNPRRFFHAVDTLVSQLRDRDACTPDPFGIDLTGWCPPCQGPSRVWTTKEGRASFARLKNPEFQGKGFNSVLSFPCHGLL